MVFLLLEKTVLWISSSLEILGKQKCFNLEWNQILNKHVFCEKGNPAFQLSLFWVDTHLSRYNHLNLIFFYILQIKGKSSVELIDLSDIVEGTNQSILYLLENFHLNHSFTVLNFSCSSSRKAGESFCFLLHFKKKIFLFSFLRV